MRKILVAWLCAILMLSVFGAVILTEISAYTTHGPIYIDGNADFTLGNGVTGGTGAQGDPYIIEDWDIDASTANGIEILNTDAYFIIRNCYVHDGGSSHDGISFYNVQNGQVENTSSLNNYDGIYLDYSNNNTFVNNIVSSNNFDGFSLSESSYNNISNNNINSNSLSGIFEDYSNYNKISNNDISNNDYGLWLESLRNNNISNNNISNNYNGIYLDYSNNNAISNNSASNNDYGIFLGSSNNNNNIFNNSINSNNYYGISLGSSSNNNIFNNGASNNEYGIYLYSSSNNNNIYNNTLSINDQNIRLSSSSLNEFNKNNITITSSQYGFYFDDTTSYNNQISISNTVNNIPVRWYTNLAGTESAPIVVSNNQVELMGITNIAQIMLYKCSYVVLTDSTVRYGSSMGIYLYSSSGNTITYNNISSNIYSVEIFDSNCKDNLFHHNSFFNGSVVNVIDNGANTKWDDGYGEGNYWSNYTGLDDGTGGRIAGDGVGDTNIPHMGLDNYPLMEPWIPPDTTPPSISSVSVSDITANSAVIIWITDEDSDSRVNYSVNSDLTSSSTKYDSTITTTHSMTLTGLSHSTIYYFEVVSTDIYRNTATDTNNSNYYRFTTSEEDTIPPVISSVSVSDITDHSAVITWITNENSNSRINYFINGDLTSNSTIYNDTMTTSHSIILTGLSGLTIYYFEVSSTDSSGNTATDTNNSYYYRFTTSEEDTIPPVISSVSISDITANSVIITWITDENSDSIVRYSVNVDLSSNSTEYYSLMTTNHFIVLDDLSPSTTYYFEVSSTDAYGNTVTDDNNTHYYTFITETEGPAQGEPFSILDYWWVMLLVIIIVVIVVIVAMVWRKK